MAKSKPKKKSKPKPAFPFFGAGNAGYFEWFEMWVWFASPVPKTKRSALKKLAPAIGVIEWPHDDLLQIVAADIQGQLVTNYGTAKAKKRMGAYRKKLETDEEADPWGGDSDEVLAMGDEQDRFNKALDAWLIGIHALQPILFVARREDLEAGGTTLSAWHKRSLAQLPAIEAKVASVITATRAADKDARRHVAGILDWFKSKAASK